MMKQAVRSDRIRSHKPEQAGATPAPAPIIYHGVCKHCQRDAVLSQGYCDNCSFMRPLPRVLTR